MGHIKVSAEEIESLRLHPQTLDLAVNLVRVNGYVVLEKVLPDEKISALHSAFCEGLENFIRKRGTEIYETAKGFNEGTNHLGLFLPFAEPFNDSLVIEHPFALAIVDKILGEDCNMTLFSSNTTLPGGRKCQPVHADYGSYFGDLCHVALPITELVYNIPLVDVNERNAPMEIWPGGTHQLPDNMYGPRGVDIEALAAHMQSVKVHMPAGSILIRDARMWHRGTINHSSEPRPNIALMFSARRQTENIQIPQETYDNLSNRAKHLLRFQKIGFPAIEFTHENEA
ncbi:phytanoyl-CoA dioxygenase family protein [Alicyclobacillus fodiniaquatilis]|jgi:ectoine hydroxylase-related dioxygenase (phytanoyl-CoA dioxygenase family)|uniref:Phytanoyl-CoA dioxygenase family protein n=1 Tax=Alicyclobacillus fodiniaquatilis TaxID=1661150 RepID=A0ABW4JPJ6_9BACL